MQSLLASDKGYWRSDLLSLRGIRLTNEMGSRMWCQHLKFRMSVKKVQRRFPIVLQHGPDDDTDLGADSLQMVVGSRKSKSFSM